MSAALKYALTQMFAVPTQDTVDADSETIPIQAKAEKPKPVKKVEAKPLEKKEISVDPNKVVTEKQVTRLFTIAGDCGWSNDELRHFLQEQYNKTTTRALVQSEYNEFISFIQESKKKEDDVAWDAGLTT
jgi:bacterioferritin-associated ferredoxin